MLATGMIVRTLGVISGACLIALLVSREASRLAVADDDGGVRPSDRLRLLWGGAWVVFLLTVGFQFWLYL